MIVGEGVAELVVVVAVVVVVIFVVVTAIVVVVVVVVVVLVVNEDEGLPTVILLIDCMVVPEIRVDEEAVEMVEDIAVVSDMSAPDKFVVVGLRSVGSTSPPPPVEDDVLVVEGTIVLD
jgi:hypothetical protein